MTNWMVLLIGVAVVLVFELGCILVNAKRRRESQDAIARAAWDSDLRTDVDSDRMARMRSERWE